MPDIYDKQKRSQMMSKIKSKDTKPELYIRKKLFSLGFRYRLQKKINGTKPDIVLKKYKLCIFINGCFWHQHSNCKFSYIPKTNKLFWEKKFQNNKNRDKKNYNILRNTGWRILVIWECYIRKNMIKNTDFIELIKGDIKFKEI